MNLLSARTVKEAQQIRNDTVIQNTKYMRQEVVSRVLPLQLDIDQSPTLGEMPRLTLEALQIESARIAIKSLASLAKINELDHLGGGLDLIQALPLTLALTDYERVEFTIENAHASVGYYALLGALGFLDEDSVIDGFRRGLDVPGHVSWVPGGTQLNGGRLGVMVPVAVGQALGKKARHGKDGWVIVHCGDAGWISGQALNGFNAADAHGAPVTFVMHRNGIQLSGATKSIMDKDPRSIIQALGVDVLEVASLHDQTALYAAYREARRLARDGRPSLIYPIGHESANGKSFTLRNFAEMHGILKETETFAAKNNVDVNTPIWAPGSLMSYRDVIPMLECVFLVNQLPGGAGHHDGHMKGRSLDEVLANPMLQMSDAQQSALDALKQKPAREVVTRARPASGSSNLLLAPDDVKNVKLPEPGASASPRQGSQLAYELVARAHPADMFVVSCDLDVSTKLDKARKHLAAGQQFEMSIEEQAAALLADGLSMTGAQPRLTVFSTFAAFFEGIAREGFEMWRYQRNLTGANEGLNVAFHLSHVGACTGRDHFSGWSLDWINLALGYLPYLHRFYAPADARAAFLAVKDLAAHSGGHIIAIPRDNLPILAGQDGAALWSPEDAFEPVTEYRRFPNARKAIVALGAPAYMAAEAAAALSEVGEPVDVHILNCLPLPEGWLAGLFERYPEGVVTLEDGLIGTPESGMQGIAGLISAAACGTGVLVESVGIVDPRIAPSDGMEEVWEHFGITANAVIEAVRRL